jgi:hypothetical protein
MAYEHAFMRYRNLYAKLLCLYPKPYRERFGEGMEQTFNDLCREREEAGGGLFRFVLWAFVETSAGIIKENLMYMQNTMNVLMKKPSAWLPIAMSLIALAFVLGYVAVFGVV